MVRVDVSGIESGKETVMNNINDKRIGREARDEVGASPPTSGENRVQAAMRRYLGAAASRRDKQAGKKDEPKDTPPSTG